jgi:2-polyprenyl-3-methyl-5-hydroxy-6-metoxy-1,4-benzoquinol methylase
MIESTPARSAPDSGASEERSSGLAAVSPHRYKQFIGRIIEAYDSTVIRAYSKVRFTIININILHILALCLRGQRRVLDVGCGFGLFGCYFSALYPEISYCGYDLSPQRIAIAQRAAQRLGLRNASFHCQDARGLNLRDEFDAVLLIDLLHHLDDGAKSALLETCAAHLAPAGRLIVKDVTTHPAAKLAFTWALDVLMTRGLAMWYWNEEQFHTTLRRYFDRIDTFPITDWMPYPHVVYLCENVGRTSGRPTAPAVSG